MLDASGSAGIIGSAASAIEAAIAADLAAAEAAGNAQQLKVDLQALYDYYYKVKAVHDEFKRALADLPQAPISSQQLEVSTISGVDDSVQTTVIQALNETTPSLKRSAAVVSAQLAKHLCNIADTYKAYLNVDDDKASELQGAGTSAAGDINFGGGSRAAQLAQEQATLAGLGAVLPGGI
jgi:hypothetical protein